jgi:hypothetical protein
MTSQFVINGTRVFISPGGSMMAGPACRFSFSSHLPRNAYSVEEHSTSINTTKCSMRMTRKIKMRGEKSFTMDPDRFPGCPCQSNVINDNWITDIAGLKLNEVWAQLIWNWDGAITWSPICVGGRNILSANPGWYYIDRGTQYCETVGSSRRDRWGRVKFGYLGPFCYYLPGISTTYSNVYVTGGITGGYTTGQTVDISAAPCPPLYVNHRVVKYW